MKDEKTREKMLAIYKLWQDVSEENNLVKRFFDVYSDKMLDEKIKVLTELKNGKMPGEVKGFYEVLEKYPQKGVYWGVN